jgi:crotonobetainyl-CoA:carnitine CoA-transferase CaiB-like acyl-CoA transferase
VTIARPTGQDDQLSATESLGRDVVSCEVVLAERGGREELETKRADVLIAAFRPNAADGFGSSREQGLSISACRMVTLNSHCLDLM